MRHSLTEIVRAAVAGWRERRAHDRAVRTALARFGAQHPTWYASLFDATFVERIGVEAVLAGPSIEVARSWTLQIPYADEQTRERDVRQMVPVVESFAALLCEALDEAGLATSHRCADRLPERPCAPFSGGGLVTHGRA